MPPKYFRYCQSLFGPQFHFQRSGSGDKLYEPTQRMAADLARYSRAVAAAKRTAC